MSAPPTSPSLKTGGSVSSSPGGVSRHVVVALVVGVAIGVVFVVVIGLGICICWRKKMKREQTVMSHDGRVEEHQVEVSELLSSVPAQHSPVPAHSPRVFTYEELEEAIKSGNYLGEGAFGCVYKGVLDDGSEVAIKRLNIGNEGGDGGFLAEVATISRVHHRNIVSLIGYCLTENMRFLVYKFVPNNTLDFHLHGTNVPALDWETRKKISAGLAAALAYLHTNCNPNIIHRDIKASNLLLDNDYKVQLGDFGLARNIPDSATHIFTQLAGTRGYMAPELHETWRFTDKSDVYAYGVVLLELVTGRPALDRTQSSTSTTRPVTLVEWAKPLIRQAMKDNNYGVLADPKLQNNYNPAEMAKMIACAADSVQSKPESRPQMDQVVFELSENMPRTYRKRTYSSNGSSYNNSGPGKQEMGKFWKMLFDSRESGGSDNSGNAVRLPSSRSEQLAEKFYSAFSRFRGSP